MSKPLVAAVITFCDQDQFLLDAVKSVERQTYTNIEIIIVDDCSSKLSAQDLLGERTANLKIVRHRENLGPAAARNTGVAESTGELILFLDADDLIAPNFVEVAVPHLSSDSGTQLVHTSIETCGDFHEIQHPEVTLAGILAGDSPPRTFMCSRSLHLSISGYKAHLKFGENSQYWLSILRSGHRPLHLREPLYLKRIHQDSRSSRIEYAKEVVLELLQENEDLYHSHLEEVLIEQKQRYMRDLREARRMRGQTEELKASLRHQYKTLTQHYDSNANQAASTRLGILAQLRSLFGGKSAVAGTAAKEPRIQPGSEH